MCQPKYEIGEQVAWTNGALGTIVDGPFAGSAYRCGAGYEDFRHPYTPFSYVVEFEKPQPDLGGRIRLLPEGALHAEWKACGGDHRRTPSGSWETRRDGQ